MDKNQKNKIQLIILLVILIGVIVLAVKVFNKKDTSEKGISGEKTGTSAIDINDPAYEGKKVYEKDGDIIIEDKDGSKTIETTKTKENTGLKETTEERKEKYQITDVKVSTRGSNTIITGKIKNNDNKEHKVIVDIKFYSEDNKIKGATSTKVNVGKGETKDFSMSIMDNVAKYKYNIQVEYED